MTAFLLVVRAPVRLPAIAARKRSIRYRKKIEVRRGKALARRVDHHPTRVVVRHVARRRYYRRPYYRRIVRRPLGPHLLPARVIQIQDALIKAGYLTGQPTGEWDAATSEAMRRYQAANGFDVTGLPEAKPLMKLGLGPHPLPATVSAPTPADVDPNPPSDLPNPSATRPAASNPPGR
jgi:hypothetical protein